MKEYLYPIWSPPAELELLLRIALRQSVTQLPEGLDWDYFDALAEQHRIQPLLIRGLRSMDPALVEQAPALKKYQGQQNRYALKSMERLRALAQVNAAFLDAGIRMISMKGPMLAMELYGDPGMRTSRDLDIMTDLADLARAGEVLEGLGFRQKADPCLATPLRRKFYERKENDKHIVYYRGEVCVELHWKSGYQTEQSFDALWEKREEQMLMGRPIALMGAADRYPALVVHAAEHGFLRLRWLLDLYELQKKPQFSWARLYESMREQGIGELLLETILVMYRLDLPGLEELSCPGFAVLRENGCVALRVLEDQTRDAEKAGSLCEAVYPLLLRQVNTGEPEWKAYDHQLPAAIYERTLLQRFLAAVGPSVYEYELVDLPDGLFWLYFIIRPFCWLRRKFTGGKA